MGASMRNLTWVSILVRHPGQTVMCETINDDMLDQQCVRRSDRMTKELTQSSYTMQSAKMVNPRLHACCQERLEYPHGIGISPTTTVPQVVACGGCPRDFKRYIP